jgi:hypothetical protein
VRIASIDNFSQISSGNLTSSNIKITQDTFNGLLDLLKEEGINIKVTSWTRPNARTSSGTLSHHASGNAIDIVPGDGETWETIRSKFKGNQKLYDYFKKHGIGIFDETTNEALAQSGGTGAHWHIGPDKVALEGLSAIMLQEGGSIENKLLEYVGTDIKEIKKKIKSKVNNLI